MATHLILFKQLGENATTPHDPSRVVAEVKGTVAVLTDGTEVDLTETTTCCRTSDDNMLVSKDLYSVKRVTLPDWLDAHEWLRNTVTWKYAWGTGVEQDWPENVQRRLAHLSTAQRMAACKLYKTKNFRSSFRKSLREQLDAWLDGESDYASPFSPRQWDCLIRNRWEAKRVDSSLYWAHGCWSTKLEPVELAA